MSINDIWLALLKGENKRECKMIKLHLESMTVQEAQQLENKFFRVSIEGKLISDVVIITTDDAEELEECLTMGVDYLFNTIITHGHYVVVLTARNEKYVLAAGEISKGVNACGY